MLYIVPEVNFLFERPIPESKSWYLERQVDRWQIAQEKLESHNLVLFDGDPFQPLWYNWIYQNDYPGSLPFLNEFYSSQIQKGNIEFPDLYIHLSLNEKELRKRKENDKTRRRRNFEKHLGLIEPQKRFFQHMNAISPGLVKFVDAVSIEGNIDIIEGFIASEKKINQDSLYILENIMKWLKDIEVN
ncbi:chloramphenicol acetyltransferase [Bacillus sp. 1P06AnD]|uniref:chloramphenicol acetyltransferase n=1 Tax=Bacillus sp. 1P06AnD TaxID=3132208 RepID=UPI00399FD132